MKPNSLLTPKEEARRYAERVLQGTLGERADPRFLAAALLATLDELDAKPPPPAPGEARPAQGADA